MDDDSDPVIPDRIRVLGVPVDVVNMGSAIDRGRALLKQSSAGMILAINPEKVIAAQNNLALLRALENAALVIPDGIGVVAAARLLEKARMKRVAGADLMPELCRIAATDGYSIFLFGAKADIVDRAAALLLERFPGLKVAGTQHGYIADVESSFVVQKINDSGAKLLFVGLGSPKQELWMDQHRAQLNVGICQGVGGSFDAICGRHTRAPKLVRDVHLEWLYRLASQPGRLSRQKAIPLFVLQVIKGLFRRKTN